MKKVLIPVIVTLLVLAFMVQMGWLEIFGIHRVSFYSPDDEAASDKDKDNKTADAYSFVTERGVRYRVKAEGDYFYFFENGEWNELFLTGVNIGATEPGLFPGELTVSYESYLRWFKMISEMNCNCIRVYTTMRPQFYKAFRDFNMSSDKTLLLFQGVWMDEVDIDTLADVYADNNKILTEFKNDALDAVDVIHGNAVLPERSGFASGAYVSDCSDWFGGWILGIEWDPKFVLNTNNSNQHLNSFDGTYFYTQGATPFEAFLAEVSNAVVEYETDTYKFQAPLAVTNWITTDPISHIDEPHEDEDLISVYMENIKARGEFLAGLFLSYHIYPYYPDSLNYQRDYLAYIDEDGKVNTYEAYLEDLKLAHTLPMLVAEFGIATSRGMGHESVMGYNQGGVDETAQGEMILDMFDSMHDSGYAGGLIFTWQDEWFKRTWNNVNFDIADERPFWSNIQTTEQCFGLLSFDPGETVCKCYPDGDFSDWVGDTPYAQTDYGNLYMKSDERYVYFMVDMTDKDFDFKTDTLYIPVDIIGGQGNTFVKDTGITFDSEADFLISINGADNSHIYVDSYYDVFYYQFVDQYKMLPEVADISVKNSGRFETMRMCYGYELEIPTTKEKVPFKYFETGKLVFGDRNPDHDSYSSLADFCYADGKIEIAIPWQLFNVTAPAKKMVMDDFYAQQVFTSIPFEYIYAGVGFSSDAKTSLYIPLSASYTYNEWTLPTFHERLKPAYYDLQKGLEIYHEDN